MLRVFMTGLIYFNGCNAQTKRAFAPDARDTHQASLWIASDLILSEQWSGTRVSRTIRVTGGGPPRDVEIIEFRITTPTLLQFPDGNDPMWCDDLENKLAKYKAHKPGGTEVDFEADPATAQTIAEVELRGGRIEPRRFTRTGVVEWTIGNHGAIEIIAAQKGGGVILGRIVLKDPADLVFSNMHDVFVDEKKDVHGGNHIAHFLKLDATLAGATLVVSKLPGQLELHDPNDFIDYLRGKEFTCGESPSCCCLIKCNQ